MTFDAEFRTWWDRLSDANGTRLKTAAGDDVLTPGDDPPAAADRPPAGPHRNQVGDPDRPDAGVPARDRVELAGAGAPVRAVSAGVTAGPFDGVGTS